MAVSSQQSNALQLREVSLTANVLTVVAEGVFFRNTSRLVAGAMVNFSNVATNTFLNGASAVLTSATRDGKRWTLGGPLTHANVGQTGDSGDVFIANPISTPGARPSSASQFPAWVRADMQFKESQESTVSDGGK